MRLPGNTQAGGSFLNGFCTTLVPYIINRDLGVVLIITLQRDGSHSQPSLEMATVEHPAYCQ